MGIKMASKRNLHFVKTTMPMNESYHIFSFAHFPKFTDKLTLLCHLLDLFLSYEKWEED